MIPWNNESVWLDAWSQNKRRSLWPIFYGSVILPYILKAIWCINVIPWRNDQYDLMLDLKIKVGHCDLYFMVQWFCLISWRLFDVLTWYLGKMSQYDLMLDRKIKVGHCDLYFTVQWFCLISWRLFEVWTWYLGIMSQYDLMLDFKIKVGHCDLYFMVQWLCLIAWRLFDV